MNVRYFRTLSLFLLSLLVLTGCGRKQKVKRERSIRVSIEKLQSRVFQERIPIKGTVQAVDSVTLSSKTAGTLNDFPISEGNHLKKGSLLFCVDRITLENAVIVKEEEIQVAKTELATAEIELKLAKTRDKKAKIDYDRALRLANSKAMAKSELETNEVNWQAAEALVEKCKVAVQYRKAKLKQAQTDLMIAKKNLKDAMVTAPYDCLVTETIADECQYVQPGTNIVKIERLNDLQVVAYLNATYHPSVVVGKTLAEVSFDNINYGSFPVTYAAETIDPMTRTFKIKVHLPKTLKICSGILCNLDIILSTQKGQGVPESAVLQTGNTHYVFVTYDGKKVKKVIVRKGIVDRGYCRILNPEVLKNANVIVAGQRFVNDGDKVTIAE